jgi:serine/threonine protein kinase
MVWERSAVPNPRLLGRFQGDAIILEYVDGKELSYYANYISRRKPNGLSADKEQAFIDLALKILEAYKRTYADKGYVHGDISPTDIMVVEKNGKVERVVFFDNDTPAPLNSRLVVDELRKNAFKHLFASRDRQNRTEPLSLKERCLPRDDVYSLCETLICVLSDLFRDTITPRGKLRGLNLKLTNYKILAESADFGNKPLLNDLIVKVKELTGGSSAADATAAVLGADILRPLPEPALSSV